MLSIFSSWHCFCKAIDGLGKCVLCSDMQVTAKGTCPEHQLLYKSNYGVRKRACEARGCAGMRVYACARMGVRFAGEKTHIRKNIFPLKIVSEPNNRPCNGSFRSTHKFFFQKNCDNLMNVMSILKFAF